DHFNQQHSRHCSYRGMGAAAFLTRPDLTVQTRGDVSMSQDTTTREAKNGLLPTPPLPQDLPPVELTENARKVLLRRYVRRGPDGQPAETVEEMFWRVA